MIRISAGEVWFQDIRLDKIQPYDIVKHGIAHVPEARQLFPEMTVLENLEVGSLAPAAKAKRKQTPGAR